MKYKVILKLKFNNKYTYLSTKSIDEQFEQLSEFVRDRQRLAKFRLDHVSSLECRQLRQFSTGQHFCAGA